MKFRHLDLNLLRVFDEVMSERNLTRAAQKLSLTQPAVSNALRRLREHLEDELLVREGQKLKPTTRALTLWPQVREALAGLEQALVLEQFSAQSSSTVFTLTMADATAAELLPSLSRILEQEAPNTSLRVTPLTTRDPRAVLMTEEVDFAVGYFPQVKAELSAQAHSDEPVHFEHHRLFEGEYVCVMRKGHPLSQEELTLEQFCNARHMLVSYSGKAFGFVDEALTELNLKRRIVVTVNQFATAARVVLNSELLTVLPRHFVHVAGLQDALCIKDLPLKLPPVHIDLLGLRGKTHLARNQWLHQTLTRAAKELFQNPMLTKNHHQPSKGRPLA